MQFRTLKNYRNGAFLGPRIGDKLIFSLLIFRQALQLWRLNNTPVNYRGSILGQSCSSSRHANLLCHAYHVFEELTGWE